MASDLSILVVTRAEPSVIELLRRLEQAADAVGAQFVVVADGDEAQKRLRMMRSSIDRVDSKGYIESVLDEAVSKTNTKYVLRVDDDESLSPGMIAWIKSGAYRQYDNWKFCRAHFIIDEKHFATDAPLWTDHQTRLSVRSKSGSRSSIHAGSPFGGGRLSPGVILHHKFLVKTTIERREIAARYEMLQRGAGQAFWQFSVPEDGPTLSLGSIEEAQEAAAIEARVDTVPYAIELAKSIGMHQHDKEIDSFSRFIASRRPVNVVEIGTLHGGTAALWHELSTGTVVSIDLPDGRFGGRDHGLDIAACERRSARLESQFSRMRCVLGNSRDDQIIANVKRLLGGEPIDLLFIDGDHTYGGAMGDYASYRRLLRPGSIVAFHDVLDTPIHRAAGCVVHDVWGELKCESEFKSYRLFSVDGPWGGIGALEFA